MHTGSAVPNSVGRRTLAGAKAAVFAPLDFVEKDNGGRRTLAGAKVAVFAPLDFIVKD